MTAGANITDEELVAYADGQLPEARAREIDAICEINPVLRDQVARDREIVRQLRAALEPKLTEPVPSRFDLAGISRRLSRRRVTVAARIAAALLIFIAGAGAGWLVRGIAPTAAPTSAAGPASATGHTLVADATLAHRTYARENRHAVEVAAAEQEHLVRWLGNRLDHKLSVPDLTGEGFRLMGGRLLPSPAGPAGQLMYENGEEVRLTLYIRPETGEALSFRFAEDGGTAAFYWIENGLAFSLTGDIPREQLLNLASIAHRDLGANHGDSR